MLMTTQVQVASKKADEQMDALLQLNTRHLGISTPGCPSGASSVAPEVPYIQVLIDGDFFKIPKTFLMEGAAEGRKVASILHDLAARYREFRHVEIRIKIYASACDRAERSRRRFKKLALQRWGFVGRYQAPLLFRRESAPLNHQKSSDPRAMRRRRSTGTPPGIPLKKTAFYIEY